MLSEEIRPVLLERLRILTDTDDEWDYGIEKCCRKEVDLLSKNISDTIHFFTVGCSDEDFFWLAEVFSDVSEKVQSKELVEAMRARLSRVTRETYDQASFKSEHMRKWVDYDEYVRSVGMEIDYAEGALNEFP